MSRASQYICVYFSFGPNYLERLKHVRLLHPQARICAMVPAGFALSDAERAHVDEVIETELPEYSLGQVAACARLVRNIRRARFSCFIVMFNSLNLRVLAALSGAAKCECWERDNRILLLHRRLFMLVLGLAARTVLGWARYLQLLAAVYLRPLRAPGDKETRLGLGSPYKPE